MGGDDHLLSGDSKVKREVEGRNDGNKTEKSLLPSRGRSRGRQPADDDAHGERITDVARSMPERRAPLMLQNDGVPFHWPN
ncbi:hypothetical protein EVAR_21332_1 [Eumeta japonica]|uniref:Uncharacterized protein n=1 Tax=Eumeta variegata TaxID=151549 RepID=A0A4C1ZSS2_EUMVA|nr:hypothetical protein EVAR_21332_1 [Eumeta japonica]